MCTSASEVICEALRIMEEQDRVREAQLEQLRQDIHEGFKSGEAKTWDPEDIKLEDHKKKSRP